MHNLPYVQWVPAGKGSWACPHCHGKLGRRTSKRKSSLVRMIVYECRNPSCGATFLGREEILYRLRPPFVKNAIFDLMPWPGFKHLERTKRGEAPTRGVCPLCRSRLHATCLPTKDPLVWALHVECTRSGCQWRASGPVAVAEEGVEVRAPSPTPTPTPTSGETVRVNFEIDQAAHAKLKASAVKQGKTIRALLTAYAKSLLADKKP